ncbi:MAG: TonB-dependent receptor [Thermodesulfobacteriota bacterium]|nr:TonB-dependent receptor [Thermodesulfobacteriota bacterium]
MGKPTNILKKSLWMLAVLTLATVLPLSYASDQEADTDGLTEHISPADQEELEKLKKTVDYLTDIVTKTRLNADYVPGIVTVLYGDDLEARGVRTVGEALTLVPGINLFLTSRNSWKTVIRGVSKTFASGQMKILLDDMPMTTSFGIDLIPNMPLEQVERIEIIRGPGSAIHGEFAYAGVMNIITRSKGNRVFGSAGSHDMYLGGGVFSNDYTGKDLELSFNLAGMTDAGSDITAVSTYDVGTAQGNDTSVIIDPADVNVSKSYGAGLFKLNYNDFSLRAHLIENAQDDSHRSNRWGVMANQTLNLTSSLKAEIHTGLQSQTYDTDDMYPYTLESAYTYSDDWIYEFNCDERLFHGGAELIWNGWDHQTLLLGWSFAKTELEYIRREDIYDIQHFEDTDRLLNSIFVQDEFRISDRFTLTTGLRYDHYDDIGDNFTPRIAAVYRLNKRHSATPQHIVKAQYAQSFRPPTFLEMRIVDGQENGDDPTIELETADTYEFGYIYRSLDMVWRVTFFYSDLEARLDEVESIENREHYLIKGVELELEHSFISDALKLDSNLSYADSADGDMEQDLPEMADWIANVGIIYQPFKILSLALQYRYVSDLQGKSQDSSNLMPGYHTVNITFNLFNLGLKGLTLRAGIKNLFEEDIPYSSDIDNGYVSGSSYFSYPEDSPQARWWWFKVSYEF